LIICDTHLGQFSDNVGQSLSRIASVFDTTLSEGQSERGDRKNEGQSSERYGDYIFVSTFSSHLFFVPMTMQMVHFMEVYL
jgi:hypothetical protein